ncbi:MAG: 30S ribosomal protein S17 [Candidatus Sumerlaeaceae bacterium]
MATETKKKIASTDTAETSDRGRRKSRVGKVVSSKMNKTIVVAVVRMVKHPLYHKYIKRTTKLYAHDEKNDAREGDTVRVIETRPLSKLKCWRVAEVIDRAK